jgi:hypothetical protein
MKDKRIFSNGRTGGVRKRALALALIAVAGFGAGLIRAEEKQAKKEPRLSFIFAERFRFEAWDNAVSLDDSANDAMAYTRTRTTLGLRWLAARNVEVLAKVTNEFRVYLAPKDRPFNWHEVFFDNLYVKWDVPGRLPVTVTVGRQDIRLGEGFIIADGTPGDGSRSYYFNALRVDTSFNKANKLIFLAHAQETHDKYLPVVHDRTQSLAEQPERVVGLYYEGALGRTRLDAYAMRKTTEATEPWPVAGRIDTLGARGRLLVMKRLSLTGEAAYQTGTYGVAGRSAFGGLFHLDYEVEKAVPLVKTLTFGGIFLSGDKPGTARMEGWDPIFSRWPKWSEGYIYTFTRESRPAYWSNLSSLYGSVGLDLGSRADAALTAHFLGADEARPDGFPGGAGLNRGVLLAGRLNFTVSKRLSGHFIWEHFDPGNFYRPGASSYNWLRFELTFRY